MPPHAAGSSTRGGFTSVCELVRSPHISGGRQAAGSQRAYSLGWDRQTDRQTDERIALFQNPPPYRARHNNHNRTMNSSILTSNPSLAMGQN